MRNIINFLFLTLLLFDGCTQNKATRTSKPSDNNTEFFEAIRKGDDSRVRSLLDSNLTFLEVKDTSEDYKGLTALSLASLEGHVEIVKILIAKGANVKATNADGSMPLEWAAFKGSKEIAELLVDNGANVIGEGFNNATPLHLATSREVAEYLLSKGADLNAIDKDGNLPLHGAAYRDNKEVVNLLIEKGADVNCPNSSGLNAIHLAKDKELIKMLKASASKTPSPHDCLPHYTAIFIYTNAGNVDKVRRLLEINPNLVNARDYNGRTPLHTASLTGNREIIESLLNEGANPTVMDKNGKTAIDIAKDDKVAQYLRSVGANTSR